MESLRHAAVLDIGKTNVKLVLVDMITFREIKALSMPNVVLEDGPYRHFDTEAIWRFLLASLKEYQRFYDVEAITVTAHGSCAALVDAEGNLALPVLDYEDKKPGELAFYYDRLRPDLAVSGSPRLEGGLNLGAQIFWQWKTFPEEWAKVAAILTWPQYWAFRLCGVMASEVASLGAHSDLWEPLNRRFSTLVVKMGWQKLLPPIKFASSRLGAVTEQVVGETGLKPVTGVWCGIHDSNASLLPHVLNRERPVTVVSTGTWVIMMALGGAQMVPDQALETLWNVDALGDPVPSIRFMGGREYSVLMEGRQAGCSESELTRVVTAPIRVERGAEIGQFQWSTDPASLSDGECFSAVSLFLARECARRMDWIGARGPIIVEGPFAGNALFLDALALLTKRALRTSAGNATGTSVGAALLIARPERVGQTVEHKIGAVVWGMRDQILQRQGNRSDPPVKR